MHPFITYDVATLSRREQLQEQTLRREQLRRTTARVSARTRQARLPRRTA
ncbi:hypothetical protein [Cellulosimicrobium marinum]|nr:hypothetical protein [Cellulosimicrobium marinum]MCB7136397.1 hypothetical protein [Cellulosimicrobium marinum]